MSETVKKATRDGFGDEIVELGKENSNVLVVDVDIGKSCKTGAFRKALPEQPLLSTVLMPCLLAPQTEFPVAKAEAPIQLAVPDLRQQTTPQIESVAYRYRPKRRPVYPTAVLWGCMSNVHACGYKRNCS